MSSKPLFAPPAYTIGYHAAPPVLALRWLAPYTLLEARACYRAVLAMAEAQACANWLFDVRLSGPIDRLLTEWLVQKLLVRAVARLHPQPLRLAVLTPPARFRQMETDEEIRPIVAESLAPERPYQARLFADEAAAFAWLATPPDA